MINVIRKVGYKRKQ